MRRTSATGIRGFTLIEILVVVAITGIVIALAAVNLLPSDQEIARRESGNVALAIEGARDAAWFGGRPMAVTFDEGGVKAWRYSGGEWRTDASRSRNVDASLRITSIYVDGQPLAPGDRLIFMPDGLATPFRVAVEMRGSPWAIEGDPAGAIHLVQG